MGTSRLLLWTGETMTGPFLGNAFEFRTKVGNREKRKSGYVLYEDVSNN